MRWVVQKQRHGRSNRAAGDEVTIHHADGGLLLHLLDVAQVPTDHGRSAVSISSLANGALGEHRRQDTDGMRLEIAARGCRSSVRRSTVPNCPRAEVQVLTARPPVACEISNFAELCGPFEEPTLSLFLFFKRRGLVAEAVDRLAGQLGRFRDCFITQPPYGGCIRERLGLRQPELDQPADGLRAGGLFHMLTLCKAHPSQI
jgi:hypothetical protein